MIEDLDAKLRLMRGAYQRLFSGASTLREIDTLHWREKLLLRLVQTLYRRRLEQLGEHISHGDE